MIGLDRFIDRVDANCLFLHRRAFREMDVRAYRKNAGHYRVDLLVINVGDYRLYRYNLNFAGERVVIVDGFSSSSTFGPYIVRGDDHALALAALL